MSKQTEVPTSVADQHHERSKRHRGPDTKEPNDEDLASSNNNDLFFKMLGVIFRNAKYLERVDLQALLNTSNAVASFLVESYPWKDRFLRGTDKTTPSGKYQAEKSLPSLGIPPPWDNPDFPTNVAETFELHIPLRARAHDSRRPDHRGFYPHRTDTAARGFLLVENNLYDGYGLPQFNAETGVLEDFFFPEDEDPDFPRTEVWLPRELPVHCKKCNIVCHSYLHLVSHCTTYEHQNNSIPPNRHLSEEFWDPRNCSNFLELSPFEQVKALASRQNSICVMYFRKAGAPSSGTVKTC